MYFIPRRRHIFHVKEGFLVLFRGNIAGCFELHRNVLKTWWTKLRIFKIYGADDRLADVFGVKYNSDLKGRAR